MTTEQKTNEFAGVGSALNLELDEKIKEDFAQFAAENEQKAFQLIAGMFVGYLEYLAVENGCDRNKEIKIDAPGGRNITIHSVSYNDCVDIDVEGKCWAIK